MSGRARLLDGRPPPTAGLPGRALATGTGLLETFRARAGRARALAGHWARLRRSAAALGLPAPTEPPVAEVAEIAAGDEPSRVTLRVWPRDDGRGAHVLVEGRPLTDAERDPPPARLRVVPGAFATGNPALAHKTLSRLPWSACARVAAEAGDTDALLTDAHGRVVEADSASVALVTGGAVVLPPADLGMLPGLTRAWLEGWAVARGLPVRPEPFGTDAVAGADHVLLLSAVRGVRRAATLDGRDLPMPAAGDDTADAARTVWLAEACP